MLSTNNSSQPSAPQSGANPFPPPVGGGAPAVSGVVNSAVRTGARGVKAGTNMLHFVVTENPKALNIACMFTGLALIAVSILSLLNFFAMATTPIFYLITASNIAVGLIIFIIETPASWFNFFGLRKSLFRNFGFLAGPIGRALFYIYVSAYMFVLMPDDVYWILYVVMGSVLIVSGFAQLICACCCKQQHQELSETESESGVSSHQV